MALEQLAYEEAARAIDRQSGSLDGLRRRAGILLAAISLATSFFGGLVLGAGDVRTRVAVAAGFATAFGVLAGGLCVAVLWPRAEWAFNLGATQIVRQLDETKPDEATAYRELALRLHKNYQENRGKLESLFWRFRFACIALAVEAVAWVVALAL